MIGLVGPRDSVELVLAVARQMQLTDFIVPRVYSRLNEACLLGDELRDICQVLLFTGRAPYISVTAVGPWSENHANSLVNFIPHGGADLYRTISALLLLPQFRKSFPSLSMDSIDASDASEAFDELGLSTPVHVIPLTREGDIDLNHIANEHMRLFRTGEVQFCLTCIGIVHEMLQQNGVPTMRIMHSRIVIREALEKARLAFDLVRAEASQVAACVLRLEKGGKRKTSQASFFSAARKCAQITGGKIVRQSASEIVVLATRGAAERCINSGTLPGSLAPKQLSGFVAFGVGYGATASIAEEQGRRAVSSAAIHPGLLTVIKPGQLKRHRSENLRAVERLNISPTMARRLIDAFASLDPENFTANELADTYRLSSRSARRLISLLREHRLVEECGIDKLNGPGRPTRAYRIALSRLAEALPHARASR